MSEHSGRSHAVLSASGAHRWLNCTPSARIEENEPDVESPYTLEGTNAHEIAEVEILNVIGEISGAEYAKRISKLKKSEHYKPENANPIMSYVSFVVEKYLEAKTKYPEAELRLEEKYDLTEYIPEGFCTGDATVITSDYIEIIDLKFGQGVTVNAKYNPQLNIYGIGALLAYGWMYDVKEVRRTIFQPRLKHISSVTSTPDELITWIQRKTETIKKAYAGEGVKEAGDWCKFCKNKSKCDTLASYNLQLAKHEFKPPHQLSDESLIEVFERKDALVEWAEAVHKYVLEQALKGKKFSGYKLVSGRGRRKYTNEEDIKDKLNELGFAEDQYIEPKLKALTKLEAVLGEVEFKEILGDYVQVQEGKPALVPVSDSRPAMNSLEQAKMDFND